MAKGDTARKQLTYILLTYLLAFLLSPNMLYTESYRASSLLIILLALILLEDFGSCAIILSISVYNFNIYDWEGQIPLYFCIYIIHHYILYQYLFLASFMNPLKASNPRNKQINRENDGQYFPYVAGFINKYQNAFSLFYCLDIPIGSM